jgi:two-component system, NarL family, invasion response regulator UvrY
VGIRAIAHVSRRLLAGERRRSAREAHMKWLRKVLIVEDQGFVRDVLVESLGGVLGFEVVGFTDDPRDAKRQLVDLGPDILLTDLLIQAGSTIDLLRFVQRQGLSTRPVVLTALRDTFAAKEALAAGACGYVLKSQPMREVIDAIEAVASGRRYVSPNVAQQSEAITRELRNVFGSADGRQPAGIDALSPRELEVLRLVVAGHRSAEIARSLSVSIKTIDSHRSNMYRKLAIRNTVDLVRIASLHGIGVPAFGAVAPEP